MQLRPRAVLPSGPLGPKLGGAVLVGTLSLAWGSGQALAQQAASQAEAPFDAPVVVVDNQLPPFRLLVDVNGDGQMDAIAARQRYDGLEYQIEIWHNQAGRLTRTPGQLVAPTVTTARYVGTWLPMAAGDMNGDGRADVAIATGVGYDQWLNDGVGGMTRAEFPLAGLGVVQHLTIADFDGDGAGDVALVRQDGTAFTVEVRWAVGGGIAVISGPNPFPASEVQHVVALDADGNGVPELGVWSANSMRLFAVGPTALTQLDTLVVSVPNQGSMWTVGDVDGDGDEDVVAFGTARNAQGLCEYEWFERTPSGWSNHSPQVGGPAEYLVDLDGDNDLDGVCCGGGGGGGGGNGQFYFASHFASTFEIAMGNGAGGFQSAYEVPGVGSRSMAGTADLDGDGDLDLVAGAAVFYGRGDWSRHPQPTSGLVAGRLRVESDADLDGDTDLDVNWNGGWINRGDGSFDFSSPTLPAPPPGTTYGVPAVSGDFDGDGSPDHLVTHRDPSSSSPVLGMVLIRNTGSGHWNDARPATAAGVWLGWSLVPYGYYVADFDGDGDMDIAADQSSGGVVLWRNDGTGFFTRWISSPTDSVEHVADFDGDGIPDVLVQSAGSQGIALGLGNGSFAPAQLLPSSMSAAVFRGGNAIGDLDGDGLLDIVTRGRFQGAAVIGVVLWRNASVPGNVSFVPTPLGAQAMHSAATVELCDVDGDGQVDVLAGPTDRDTGVAYYQRIRSTPGSIQASDFAPAVVQWATLSSALDADGDGDVDLVGERLIRNVLWHGAAAGQRLQYGDGSVGEGQATPTLGATGPFRAGEAVTFRLSGVPGPSLALLMFGVVPTSAVPALAPGAPLHLTPASIGYVWMPITGSGEGRGAGRVSLSLAIPALLAGIELGAQALVVDLSMPANLSSTNGLALLIGR